MASQEELMIVINELREALDYLITQVQEDIPAEEGTRHLWDAVRNGNTLLCGPTSVYVTQDPEFDKRSL
jgi:hypothetical protein